MPAKTLFEMSTAEAAELFEQTRWAIIPCGSTEQHGPHLPLGTDAMGAIAVSRRVSEKIPIVLATPITVGFSPYHMSWKGTITIQSQTLIELYKDVGKSLIAHGIDVVIFVNGHGGNRPIVDVAASDLQLETGVRTYVINWPYLGSDLVGERFDLAHAGRFETAAVMAYDPALVQIERATDPSDYEGTIGKQARYRSIAAYPLRMDFREIQPTGWSGRPQDATPEDAAELMEIAADEIVRLLRQEFGATNEPQEAS